jgi:hypothetical protein
MKNEASIHKRVQTVNVSVLKALFTLIKFFEKYVSIFLGYSDVVSSSTFTHETQYDYFNLLFLLMDHGIIYLFRFS